MLILLIATFVTVYMLTYTCIYPDGNDSNEYALSNSSNILVLQLDRIETAEFFQKIDKTLSNISDACISSTKVVYELSLTMQEHLLQNNTSSDLLLNFCNKIKKGQLCNQSWYYTINGSTLIHIDVLMLCKKFELILTKFF